MDFSLAARRLQSIQSILFVTSQLRQREIKMAHALKSLGWVVGLIYYNSTPFNPTDDFDFFYNVKSAKSAHQYARKLAPRLIHVFSGAIDDCILKFCKEKIAHTIIDLNDIFSPALMNYCPERFRMTQQAIALADGFCARDLQIKRAEQLNHFRIPAHILFFPEYCWNNRTLENQKKNDDELHIVSIGTISLETHGMYDCCYLELARLIINQRIHFHIYPPWCYRKDYHNYNIHFEKDYAQFLELARLNHYLHIHDSLPVDQLLDEIKQYDFGIIAGGFSGFGQRYSHFKPAYVESCYSGRIADYLDAGLPILINQEVFFDYWLLKRYGVSFDLKMVLKPSFKSKLTLFAKNFQVKNCMMQARSTLSILKNATRLEKFYLTVASSQPLIKRHSMLKRVTTSIHKSLKQVTNWSI